MTAGARRLSGALGLAMLASGALALWPWVRPAGQASAEAAPSRAAASDWPTPVTAAALRETAERPLFTPGRRAIVAAAPTAPAGLRLEGVVVMGKERRAIIKQADGRTARVSEGEAVGDWRVRRIDGDRVELVNGERRLELTPQRARSSNPR